MDKFKYKHILFLLVMVVMILSGCSFSKKEKKIIVPTKQITLNSEQEKNAKITTEPVKERLITIKITIPAQFKAISKFVDRSYAPVGGKVVDVFVEPGDIIKKGQPLILIKSDEIGQIQLAFLDEYILADSNYNQMVAQYNLSTQLYQRAKVLYKEGISSREEYEIASAQLLKDRANLSSLMSKKSALIKVYSERIALYGGNPSSITKAMRTKKIYPYITISSNKNGVVTMRNVNTGEVVEKNKELFNVADLSYIWLVGYAFEKDVPLLRIGQKVTGILEGKQGDNVKGELFYIASVLDENTKSLEVIAKLPNKDNRLKPNTYAEMVVDVGELSALTVPNSALQKYGDYNFAYVRVKPQVYEERKVELGQQNETYSEVKSGLKNGEMVVVEGGYSLLGEFIKLHKE